MGKTVRLTLDPTNVIKQMKIRDPLYIDVVTFKSLIMCRYGPYYDMTTFWVMRSLLMGRRGNVSVTTLPMIESQGSYVFLFFFNQSKRQLWN
jgi:hypothetical protein